MRSLRLWVLGFLALAAVSVAYLLVAVVEIAEDQPLLVPPTLLLLGATVWVAIRTADRRLATEDP